MIRHDLGPLIDAARAHADEHVSWDQLADRLGVNRRTFARWRAAGSLPEDQCDQMARMVHRHPLELWPDYLGPGARVCAYDNCSKRFMPSRKDNIYCSRQCGVIVANRKWRKRPGGAELERANAARYYAENGDYVRKSRKRRYHATEKFGRRRDAA